jgi:16S rRNA (guanine527-N7)-methyltransferase
VAGRPRQALSGPGRAGHRAALAALPLNPEVRGRVAAYLDIVERWNPRINLTGARTATDRVALLVAPVVAAEAALCGEHLIDVGSGNGSPGVVLGLLRPGTKLTLLEPRARRWAFLKEVSRELGLGARVLRQRHDEYSGPPGDTVSVRALRLPAEQLRPLIAPGGRLLLFRSEEALPPGFVRLQAPCAGVSVLSPERST